MDEGVGCFAPGHRYHAHDADALRWVFATLVDTSVLAYELGFGEVSAVDRQAYYREIRRFARLFGLGDETLPADWAAFTDYFERTLASDELGVGRPARELAAFLLSCPRAPLRPAARWYRTLTAGMLPARLREAYRLSWQRSDQVLYGASVAALRRGWRRLPERARLRPEYIEALRRIEGRPQPDRVGRALQQLVLRVVGAR
jgi:uncharacterized protein (DUF2236 family)